MQIQLIGQSYEDIIQFKKTNLKNKWDMIVLMVEGSYSILADGELTPRIISDKEIVFIPAGTTMSRSLLAPSTFYRLSFMAQAEHPFRLALHLGKLKLPAEQLASIFNSIRQAFLIPNNQELIEHIIEHILAENYLFGKKDRIANRPLSEEVLRVIRYMNGHLHEKIDIDALAERVYLSHTGLIWKFKQELNTTPSQYLTMLRLRYAKQLLLDHDYTVTEIAELCGYSNPYYFTNVFHRYTGQSPTEFRRSYPERPEKK